VSSTDKQPAPTTTDDARRQELLDKVREKNKESQTSANLRK
jgi:hypothetical protein